MEKLQAKARVFQLNSSVLPFLHHFILPYGTIMAELCPACGNLPDRDVKSKSSRGL
jgi:hypothetical protein